MSGKHPTRLHAEVFEPGVDYLSRTLATLETNLEHEDEPHNPLLGEVTQAFGLALEQLQAAEDQLRERNAQLESIRMAASVERHRYEELLQCVCVGHVVTDATGVILESNREAARLLGSGPGSLTGLYLIDALAEEDRSAFQERLDRLAHETSVPEFEVVRLHRLGDHVPLLLKASLWSAGHDGDARISWHLRPSVENQPVELDPKSGYGTPHSASDRPLSRRLEAARLRDLIHGVNTILWEAGPDGRVQFINRYAEELLGYPLDQWLSDPDFWSSITHPEDRECANPSTAENPARRSRR